MRNAPETVFPSVDALVDKKDLKKNIRNIKLLLITFYFQGRPIVRSLFPRAEAKALAAALRDAVSDVATDEDAGE